MSNTVKAIRNMLGPLESLIFVKSKKTITGDTQEVFKCGIDVNCKKMDQTKPNLDSEDCLKCEKRTELK